MSEENKIICKVCGKEAEVISYPEEGGAYEIYCKNCFIYLDEEGNEIE